ncbi:MAG: serine hydrolase domain-containing protein [Bryobacteraceae bacterium]
MLKARVCEWIARHNTQATAFVVKHRGHTVATGATGKRAPENTSPSVQLDSVFRMSSVSKVVTASAAMALVEDGRLSLTRAVCDYLPEFSGSKETLVHNLLTHTSGLDTRDYEKLLGEVSCPTVQHTPRSRLQQMVAAACATHPRFDPGQWCLYGGINYVLLGEIIERCAGCDLNVFAKKRLFDPLDMSDSRYGIDDRLALRYVSLDPSIFRDVRPTYDPNDDFELRIPHPSGNLFSTAPDMSAFAQMFLNKGKHRQSDVLSPATVAAMTRNQIPGVFSKGPTPVLKNGSWGLGWIIQGDSQWKQ